MLPPSWNATMPLSAATWERREIIPESFLTYPMSWQLSPMLPLGFHAERREVV